MITEQDKKAILNGVLARTNNNKKAKFILKSEHEANFNYPYGMCGHGNVTHWQPLPPPPTK